MKKTLIWIKDHIVWILGGLAAFLGALLAIKYEREKVAKLKDKANIATATKEIGELKAKQEVVSRVEKKLEVEDKKVGDQISAIEEQRIEIKKEVPGMSDKEVADEFKKIYGSSRRGKKNGKHT